MTKKHKTPRPRSKPSLSRARLQRDSAEPMYLQLSRWLEGEIRRGALRAGQLLPSEPALCRDLKISRITVRQATDQLIEKRLVERRQGKGTFVAHHLIRHGAQNVNQLFDSLFAREHAASSELLAFGPAEPPPEVAAAFGVPAGQKLLQIDRLYLLQGRPVGAGVGWMLPDALGISEKDAAEHSTARLLESFLGLKLERTELAIRAAAAGRSIARHLRIAPRAPVLVLHRRRLLVDGRTGDLTRFYMNADSYEFSCDDLLALENRSSLKLFAA
jgi:GntR family transcriptional regulator